MAKIKDITGVKFGRLTAVGFTGRVNKRGALWRCLCECGRETDVVGAHLRSGHTKSCGCISRELARIPKNVKHGHTRLANKAGASEYHIWSTMKQRCLNPKTANYSRYGGRGITICSDWLGGSGYENFFRDMGPRPGKQFSLDRRDQDGPYSPSNCRWATQIEQQNNRSGTRRIEHDGLTLTSAEWSRRTGISANVIRNRIDCGWSIPDALSRPVRL